MKKALPLIGYLLLLVLTSYSNDQVEKLSPYDINTLKELTGKWNNSLVKKDLQTLATLYADQVLVYGISISKSKAIASKKEFFKLHPDFTQNINGEMTIRFVAEQQYKVSFLKHSAFNGKSIDVQGYLIFKMVSGNWKISIESDDVTDKNRNKSPKATKKLAPKSCIDVVTEILLTSPTYLEKTKGLNNAVVKNGGTSFGITLEGSPNPEKEDAQEYSKTYDFNLHETYPDHMPVIERFSFNPEDKQLYLINPVEDKLTPINFDRRLLLKFNELCK
jgi:hypothetical protein